ncbi:collagen-like triple helix repeat-containing protein [Flagellimonas sp.]|uniref:collagen-like protein n=1 Tax=Flagellimonas sp. TaxID=2058762 RepID=UPI003B508A0E
MVLTLTFIACSGEDGEQGLQGIQGNPGTPGAPGQPGTPGADGIDCWDVDADGINDPDEDINGDEKFDGLDCQGDNGTNGDNGDDGIDCWDTNGDGDNQDSEDINQDGEWNGLDCQGEQGEQGADGNANVTRIKLDLGLTINNLATQHDYIVEELTPELLATHSILMYFEDVDDEATGSIFHSVPYLAPGDGSIHSARIYSNYNNSGSAQVRVYAKAADGSSTNFAPSISFLHIILVEITTTIETQGNKGGQPQDALQDLKAAGIDITDYYAVMAYFGLEE